MLTQQNASVPPQLVLAVLCVVVASIVSIVVSIGLVKRMQRIADQPRTRPKPPASNPTKPDADS